MVLFTIAEFPLLSCQNRTTTETNSTIYLLASQTLKELAKVSTTAALLTKGAFWSFNRLCCLGDWGDGLVGERLAIQACRSTLRALAVAFPGNVSG